MLATLLSVLKLFSLARAEQYDIGINAIVAVESMR